MKLFTAFKNSKSSGFTLIELLVVIGILGILAAALVATIDPFEQLKKADDAKIKNIAVEFQTANVRYYTTHSSFPWSNADNQATNNTVCYPNPQVDIAGSALSTARVKACIDNTAGSLISEGELKSAFSTNVNDLAKVFLTWASADPTSMVVCFAPQSKSQLASAETIYDIAGAAANGVGGACTADKTVEQKRNNCYWCTR